MVVAFAVAVGSIFAVAECGVCDQVVATASSPVELDRGIEPLKVRGVKGEIDWTEGVVRVRGQGVPVRGWKGPAARNSALAAAMVDACANALVSLQGIKVTSEATIEDSVLVSTKIKSRADGVLGHGLNVSRSVNSQDALLPLSFATVKLDSVGGTDGARNVIRTRNLSLLAPSPLAASNLRRVLDGSDGRPRIVEEHFDSEAATASVTLEMLIAGGEGLLLKADPAPPADTTILPGPDSPTYPSTSRDQKWPFTGLIVDCRGLGIRHTMAPRILRPDGSEVWGTVSGVPEEILQKIFQTGVVGYVSDLDLARKTPRVGENPLLIRAIGRQGSFGAHAVVTNEDAEWILRENKETAKVGIRAKRLKAAWDDDYLSKVLSSA